MEQSGTCIMSSAQPNTAWHALLHSRGAEHKVSELRARKIFSFPRRPRKRRYMFSRSSCICISVPAPRLSLCSVVHHSVTKALSGILSIGNAKFRVLFCLGLALFCRSSSKIFIFIIIESLQSFSMELSTSTTRTLVNAPEHTPQQSSEHEYEVKVRLCSLSAFSF